MIVLSPEGKAQTSESRVAPLPRFSDLRGKVVGLLDNSKPNADKLEERFAQLLKERFGVAGVRLAAISRPAGVSRQRPRTAAQTRPCRVSATNPLRAVRSGS